MRPTNLIAALRHLASANLPGKAAWDAMHPLLQGLVGFERECLFWLAEDGQIVDAQVPVDPAVLAGLVQFLNVSDTRLEGETLSTYPEFALSGQPLEAMSRARGFHETRLYQDLIRPLGLRHMLRLGVHSQGVPLACLSVGREPGVEFRGREVSRLLEVLPLITHLLSGTGAAPAEDADEREEQAVLLVDERGHIHYASEQATYLVHRAAGLGISAKTLGDRAFQATSLLLRDLARRVSLLERGLDTSMPTHMVRQPDGRYDFRAYRLDSLRGAKPLVAVQVERHVSRTVRLYRAGKLTMLSPREQEIALQLLRGVSTTTTAERLGLKRSSVISHAENINCRLGITRREELLPALLGAAPAGAEA